MDDLVERAVKGDVEAFEMLVEQCHKKAYNQAFRMMGNAEDAADLAQDAFIKAFLAIKNFKGQSSFDTWIYKIVSNTCLDELARRKKIVTISLEETNMSTKVTYQDVPEREVERQEERQELVDALNKLSPEHKTVIVLRDVQGLSYSDIEQITGCSAGTVKSRIKRARDKLKELLQK